MTKLLLRSTEKQRENITDDAIFEHLNFPEIQKEIIERAKKYFPHSTSDFEILTELQHYGGKTNLIDFSKNFLIALFFACDGNFEENGRLICLNTKNYGLANNITDEDFENNLILEPYSKNNRAIFQSSVFIYSQNGFINKEKVKIITIEKEYKKTLLEDLEKYYDIDTDTIYNDLQGFISNSNNYKTAQTHFYIGLSYQQEKKGRYEEAIKEYNQAIELNPNFAEAYNNRGNAKHELRRYEEAIKDYDQAIELNPNFAEAHNNRGLCKL